MSLVQNNAGPGIVIGIPTLGRPVPLDWALAFKSLNPPINFNSILQIIQGSEVAAARQAMAELAVERGAKYLFFLGDDVVVPNHTIRQLIFRLEQDETIGVVGGVYCAKADPAAPLVFRENGRGTYWDWKVGEFFEVSGLGMDCTLIRVEALAKLSKPWFKTVDEDSFLDGINSAEVWTEDLYFFRKLKEETDYSIYCDGMVICDHWDVGKNKKYSLPTNSLPMRQKVVTNPQKLLIIGQLDAKIMGLELDVTTFGPESSDYRGHMSSLPFDNQAFDWLVISQLGAEFKSYLKEWFRVLKPKGKLSLHFNEFISQGSIFKYLTSLNYEPVMSGSGRYIEIER